MDCINLERESTVRDMVRRRRAVIFGAFPLLAMLLLGFDVYLARCARLDAPYRMPITSVLMG